MKAAKKASRVAADGIVMTKVSEDGNYGVILEINSETDFVARDDNFLNFANAILDKAFADKQKDVAILMAGELESAREALVQKVGENISVRRVEVVEFDNINDGIVDTYVHSNNRIAVLVALKGGDDTLAKDIAMHVAAVNPVVVRAEEVSKELLAKESEIYSAQARESGKPEEIVEKMIQGRLRKFVAEVSLLEQQFVKDPELTVAALLKKAGADVVSFTRFEVGEGIEKEEVDFAAEVAAAAAG
jgi:elongation factor Ts